MEMHAIQSKQASMSSGCIVRNPYLIALRQSCPLSDRNDEKGVAQQGRSCFSLRFFERPSTLGIAASDALSEVDASHSRRSAAIGSMRDARNAGA